MKFEMSHIVLAAFAVAGVMALIGVVRMLLDYVLPLRRIFLSGGRAGLTQLVLMRARNTPFDIVVDAYIALVQDDADVQLADIERHYLQHPGQFPDAMSLVTAYRQREDTGEHVA